MSIKNLYLIKRGPKPNYHNAPYHPVILCTLKRVAQWEQGATDKHAWVWMRPSVLNDGAGWLLVRWNGFDIDYGHVVHNVGAMPDGSPCAFWRDYEPRDNEGCVSPFLPGAVWWSHHKMPDWLVARGVVYPSDSFTQQHILDTIADDGSSGWPGRLDEAPEFWPKPIEREERYG